MNPNKRAHCCYTYRGHADEFALTLSSCVRKMITIRIGKPNGTQEVAWHAREHDDNDEGQGEYIQYGV